MKFDKKLRAQSFKFHDKRVGVKNSNFFMAFYALKFDLKPNVMDLKT